jgi:hypothetical protein
MAASAGGTLSFARDIKPLFREKDHDSMRSAFDLFDYTDASQVETLERWIDQGKPA